MFSSSFIKSVFVDGKTLLKPTKPSQAYEMLQMLSGKTHSVFTGIALVHRSSSRQVTALEETKVTFAALAPSDITAYVASGLPLRSVGAYRINDAFGALLVAGIVGDYHNVIGVPLRRLYRTLVRDFRDLIDKPFDSLSPLNASGRLSNNSSAANSPRQ